MNMESEWLELAGKRVEFPKKHTSLKYFEDVDLLVVRFSDNPTTHSKSELEKGLIYNYDANDGLTNIEILDL